ncbi:MAG: hypothetical protein QXJ74_01745 [Nitrososphaera sp.]
MTLIKDNALTVSASTSATSGYYGYGYGRIFTNLTYNPPYQYAFTGYTQDFIAGNNVGYTNYVAGANVVNGYIGPATITISGKLNTALMTATHHTLDVTVNTGAGGNGVDKLVAPQISFTVNTNPAIVQQNVPAGNTSLPPIAVPGLATPITVTINNAQTSGTIVVEPKAASALLAENPGIFSAIGSSSSLTIGTSTGNTIGAILEVATAGFTLGTNGFIEITIPYDPTLLPPSFNEANVKFFHFTNGAWQDVTFSVDTAANTVTGRLTSLSPVVAGYTSVAPSGGGAVGGGGGGGTTGGGTGIDLTPTYPDSYFVNNPLAKVQVQSTAFIGSSGQAVAAARTGGQIDIQATFKNYQQSSQNYAIIIQVIDKDGFTADVGWVTGTLASGETTNAARSWVAGDEGNYTVRIFVWDGISQTPTALSIVNDKTLTVVA